MLYLLLILLLVGAVYLRWLIAALP